jgi:hypothetical protein
MKKIFYFSFALLMCSCGDDENEESADLNNVLSEMVANNQLKKELKNKILENYRNTQEKNNDIEDSEEESDKKIEKISCFELFSNIHKDRSMYLDNYVDKQFVFTDLLLKNVYISDNGSGFVKCASALPIDSKQNSAVGIKSSERYEEYYNEYTMEYEQYSVAESGSDYFYKNKLLKKTSGLAKTEFPVIIEFKNADELKKIGLLEWEYNEGNNFNKKVSIKGIIHKENIEYSAGQGEDKDIKSYAIQIKIVNAEIYKK